MLHSLHGLIMPEDFTERLKKAFNFDTMAGIARRLGIPHATVRNYFGGRMPAPEVLIKIANETNVSLNWLLIGTGQMFADGDQKPDLEKLLNQKITEIIDSKLNSGRLHDKSGTPTTSMHRPDSILKV